MHRSSPGLFSETSASTVQAGGVSGEEMPRAIAAALTHGATAVALRAGDAADHLAPAADARVTAKSRHISARDESGTLQPIAEAQNVGTTRQ